MAFGRKQQAVQKAANSVAAATQAINDHGRGSEEAQGALGDARDAVTAARAEGATDADLRAARPR